MAWLVRKNHCQLVSQYLIHTTKLKIIQGIPITITFNRSKAQKCLLQIAAQRKGKDLIYSDESVPLISPSLSCYFVESEKAKQFYSKTKLYDVAVPFLDYSVRRELLPEGISDFRLKLFEGPLPSVIAILLQPPENFDGAFDSSTLKFMRHNLTQLEVCVDGVPVSNHPLALINNSSIPFFVDFLRRTNRWNNMLASETVSKSSFDDSNFLVFVNLKHEGFKHGQCTLNLKFASELAAKLYTLIVPIYEKRLQFDSYFNVTVN